MQMAFFLMHFILFGLSMGTNLYLICIKVQTTLRFGKYRIPKRVPILSPEIEVLCCVQ